MADPNTPRYGAPMGALAKAATIGPGRPGSTPLQTPLEAQDPIMAVINALGLSDPFGLGAKAGGITPAGVGGLPEGLNPSVIKELLKREAAPIASVATKAAKAAPSVDSIMRGNMKMAAAPWTDLTAELNAPAAAGAMTAKDLVRTPETSNILKEMAYRAALRKFFNQGK